MDKPIRKCRLCFSEQLEYLYNFGNIALGNNLLNNIADTLEVSKYPLAVQICNNCNHFQLTYSVDPNKLYATNYTYLSSIGASFVKHIEKFVEWIDHKCKISKGKFVLDIGSNDGTCLKEFKKIGYEVCGVDPAEVPAKLANKNGIFTFNDFFNDNVVCKIKKKFGRPYIITSQNALAHIDDLTGTFKRIYDLLEDGGYFVFEVGYFLTVLENNLFDTIYHEHLDYHHASPLVRYLDCLGFQVIHLKRVKSQGGSLRLLLRKNKTKIFFKEVKEFLEMENQSILYNRNFISSWLDKIKVQLDEVKKNVIKFKNAGYQIIGYGAPTKATLLLDFSNLGEQYLSFIIEDNNLKIDKFLSNGIEIKSINHVPKNSKILILILAWNFADDIIKKLIQLGIKSDIIVPLPTFRKITI